MDIREPFASEANALASAAFAAWDKGVGPLVSASARARMCDLDFANFIRENPDQILAAFVDCVAVGYVAMEYGNNYISDLWVDPAYEGNGIGSALLDAMAALIDSRGFDAVTIEVLTENTRALDLYGRLGYMISWQGIRPDGHLQEPIHKTGMFKSLD